MDTQNFAKQHFWVLIEKSKYMFESNFKAFLTG